MFMPLANHRVFLPPPFSGWLLCIDGIEPGSLFLSTGIDVSASPTAFDPEPG
jgi:hypothetical protein